MQFPFLVVLPSAILTWKTCICYQTCNKDV